jgi:hypothetical protein
LHIVQRKVSEEPKKPENLPLPKIWTRIILHNISNNTAKCAYRRYRRCQSSRETPRIKWRSLNWLSGSTNRNVDLSNPIWKWDSREKCSGSNEKAGHEAWHGIEKLENSVAEEDVLKIFVQKEQTKLMCAETTGHLRTETISIGCSWHLFQKYTSTWISGSLRIRESLSPLCWNTAQLHTALLICAETMEHQTKNRGRGLTPRRRA